MHLVSAVLHPSFHLWSVFMYSYLKLQGIRKQDFEVISGNRTRYNLHRKAAHKPTVLILGCCNCYSKGKHSNSDLIIPDNTLYYFFSSLFLSYAVSFPPIILIRFLILLEQRVAQNFTQLKGKGQQFPFFWRRNLPLAVTPILSAVV